MASKIQVGSSYFTSFVDGQGAGASNYITYAEDLDTNFQTLRLVVNQIVDELSAIQGPNSVLGLDLTQVNDPDGPLGTVTNGVIGEHSYRVSIAGDTTKLDVQKGSAIAQGGRVSQVADVQLVGSGSSGDRWVYIDGNGTPNLATAADQGALDIAKVNWDGSNFTGSVTQLAQIFPDGDDYADMLSVVGDATAGVPNQDHRKVADRFENIERLLRGVSGNVVSGGPALGILSIIRGTAAAPGVTLVGDEDSGFFKAGTGDIGVAVGGTQVTKFDSGGPRIPNGSATTPGLRFIAESGAGFARIAGVPWVINDSQMSVGFLPGQGAAVDGSASSPSWSFSNDTDTGLFLPAADAIGFSAGGSERARVTTSAFQMLEELVLSQGATFNRRSVSSTPITLTDDDFIVELAVGGVTVNLPAASGRAGKVYLIKDAGGNAGTTAHTIDPNSTEQIDGSSTLTLEVDFDGVFIASDGTGWMVLARNGAATGGGGSAFQGALAELTANESIASGSETTLPLDAAVYDTDGFWSAGSPTRLTVPEGVSRVIVAANVRWASNSTGQRFMRIRKNGIDFKGMPFARFTAEAQTEMNAASAVVDVSPGDFFELRVFQSSGGPLDVDAHQGTWFSIEAVSSSSPEGNIKPVHADLEISAAQSISDSTWENVDFDSEVEDDADWHDNATNPNRVVVDRNGLYMITVRGRFASNPTGLRQARVKKNDDGTASTGTIMDLDGGADQSTTTDLDWAFVDVLNANDFLTMQVRQTSGGSLNLSSAQLRVIFLGRVPNVSDLDDLADVAATSPSDGDALSFDASSGTWKNRPSGFETRLLHVVDEKPSGTDAGNSPSAGSYATRTLNTVRTNEISGASLSSNQITLPAGTYYIEASAPGRKCGRHKVRLRNVTDTATTLAGGAAYNNTSQDSQTHAFARGRFTLGGQKTLELQHFITSNPVSKGFGVETSDGEVEIYAEVRIWKVA